MKLPPFHATPSKGGVDYLTEYGAGQLAQRIEEVWRAAGHDNVTADPVRVQIGKHKQPVWTIKTNLINGLPPPVARVPRRTLRARAA